MISTTLATPGLKIKTIIKVNKSYKDLFKQKFSLNFSQGFFSSDKNNKILLDLLTFKTGIKV